LEELAVGLVAGAFSKFFTTPLSNAVKRMQTGSYAGDEDREATLKEILDGLHKERGLAGLWSGYSESLVLALNPSITHFLHEFLKSRAVAADRWDNPGAPLTFLLAAVSKSVATAITYPFQIAKTRIQTPVPADIPRGEEESIFGTVAGIARAEGVRSLYAGLPLELLQVFLGHGTTMAAK
ncbi:hypothetical protein M426DRAFT_43195, partial [Hypoxylon sp. CI-4A]